jgi:hypothetical protein
MVEEGKLVFDNMLIDPQEFLTVASTFSYLDVHGCRQAIELEAGSLAYTICQTPVVLRTTDRMGITVHFSEGAPQHIKGNTLDANNSRHIFLRDGWVQKLTVTFPGT